MYVTVKNLVTNVTATSTLRDGETWHDGANRAARKVTPGYHGIALMEKHGDPPFYRVQFGRRVQGDTAIACSDVCIVRVVEE